MAATRNFRLRSLKSRLALWVIVPSALIFTIDLGFSYRSSEQIATLVQQQLLHGAAAMISEQLSANEGDYEISVPPAAFELLKNRYKDRVSYAIRGPDGQLIAGDEQVPAFEGKLAADGEEFFLAGLRGESVRIIAYSYVIPSSATGDAVITQVAQSLRGHNEFRDELWYSTVRRHLMLMSVTLAFLAMAFRWMLKPLVAFSNSLTQRQAGSLDPIDESEAPAELAPVIRAMNDYVRRLDHTLKSYGKFVADTAHHLRNSFAIIATQVNFARRSAGVDAPTNEVLGAVQKTLGKCTRVINQLLVLAALDQPGKLSEPAAPVCLASLVARAIEEHAPLAQQKQIELGVDVLDESVIIPVPRRFLQELIANLIGNAIQHMKKAGTVTLSVCADGQWGKLIVVDDGVGIPEDQREKVFERFYRLDESSPDGSGLGLAIVKEICDSLGASVALATPAGGSGLQVEVRFPLGGGSVPAD